MKRKVRGGHRLALVCIASVMTSLGSSSALADESPTVTLDPTVDGSTSATSIDDPGDATETLVDTVSSTTSTTVDTVSSTTSTTVDTVSSTTSTTVDTVSDAASGAAGATEALGSPAADSGAGTASGTADAAHHPGSSAHTVTSSNSTPGALRLTAHRGSTLPPTRSEGMLAEAQGEGPCSARTSQVCSFAPGENEDDSLAEKVAKIIGLLALTGLRVLPWVAAAVTLTVVGSLALERGRSRRSQTGHATAP
jgi:hypothetical protein